MALSGAGGEWVGEKGRAWFGTERKGREGGKDISRGKRWEAVEAMRSKLAL